MSTTDDMAAIDAYFIATPAVTPTAVTLKDQWRSWYDQLGFFGTMSSDNYDEARNRRNAFNLANATTPAAVAQVKEVMKTGVSTEQAAGDADRRDSEGNLPDHPPDVIPLEYKIVGGVLAVLALVLVIKKI
jgi:hypothetical protein